MGFSPEVKEKAYAASARRCCVCKKFKGRNIEVHHIVQNADGGEDTFENAIPLCFDCHAEAGHYNPRHPKGAKYSPSELREHRDHWYKVVADGKAHVESSQITHQYFVTNSIDIVAEIVEGDFSNFPLDHVKLTKNKLFDFLKSACAFQGSFSRESDIDAGSYDSVDAYRSKHSDAKLVESSWGATWWTRGVTCEEIQNLAKRDFVANYMLRYGAGPSDIARAVLSLDGCGSGDSYYEIFQLRRAKVVFLAVTNTTKDAIHCESITEDFEDGNQFAEVGRVGKNFDLTNLNNIPLLPGECLLIPICVVLLPFELDSYSTDRASVYEHINTGEAQDLRKVSYPQLSSYPTIGPYHQISAINFLTDGNNCHAEFRGFSLGHLFLISRSWECGSCPHIFTQHENLNVWVYQGELFSGRPDETQKYTISQYAEKFRSTNRIRIVELEKEITFIDQILVDGKIVAENIVLCTNEQFEIEVGRFELVEITGRYSLLPNVSYKNSQEIKLQKVFHTLSDMNGIQGHPLADSGQ